MFTGLVSNVGVIRKAEHRNGLVLFDVEGAYDADTIEIGASILHAGVCLTVVAKQGANDGKALWTAEAVPETLAKSVLGAWDAGQRINLERSMKIGDELGGHFVYGHVDGVGEVVSVEPEGQSYRLTIRPPAALVRYFASKGSVAIDGASLTIAQALPNGDFSVAIIPHTWQVTTLGDLEAGDVVNLEVDMLARYVARMVGVDAPEG